MKFQVGDKVLVLHSNEEGEIIDIINPLQHLPVIGASSLAYATVCLVCLVRLLGQERIIYGRT